MNFTTCEPKNTVASGLPYSVLRAVFLGLFFGALMKIVAVTFHDRAGLSLVDVRADKKIYPMRAQVRLRPENASRLWANKLR